MMPYLTFPLHCRLCYFRDTKGILKGVEASRSREPQGQPKPKHVPDCSRQLGRAFLLVLVGTPLPPAPSPLNESCNEVLMQKWGPSEQLTFIADNGSEITRLNRYDAFVCSSQYSFRCRLADFSLSLSAHGGRVTVLGVAIQNCLEQTSVTTQVWP